MIRIFLTTLLGTGMLVSSVAAQQTAIPEGDWPQLGRDAGRTAFSPQGPPPPYRARWIWLGTERTLRNRASNPAWPDNLRLGTGPGENYPMPRSVPHTFSGRVQPVVAGGRLFIGDMEGRVYAIALDDGRTLWVGQNPGGTAASAAVAGDVVVVTAITGGITALDAATGKLRWRVETPKAITAAPLAVGGRVFSGCHDGHVYAIDAATGRLLWKSDTGAPIVADLCGDESAVFVGSEDMYFHKLDINTGSSLARARLTGQSFRMTHPMMHQGLLFVQTVQGPCVGSEYIMEGVMRDSPDIATEQKNILRWLSGDTNGGRWGDASPDWKHLHVMRAADLNEPYVVPNGPADGCGSPAPSPCVDYQGRVLTWFKTAHPTLTGRGSFGTRYSMDISAIDLTTGLRVPIDNGRLSGTSGETDNLFALSCGGPYLFMRQSFRGTKLIDLRNSQAHMIQAAVRVRDGGVWNADVVYVETSGLPSANQQAFSGRTAPTIAGGMILFAESFGVTAVESRGN